ncbi:MAG: ABC transporter ATP-binding protein [Candidatus Dormibacteria bacterium]
MPGQIRLVDARKDYRIRTVGTRDLKDLVRLGRPRAAHHFHALRGITLSVEKGESLGVLGANGAGKSTLLKLLAGTTRPTSGTVEVGGRVSALLELGAGFHPDFSGRENVFLNGALVGIPRRDLESRFDDIVAFSGVGQFIDQPVKTYSSGMYVRLAFSVAVHTDPDILLVDEVLAVGDEAFQNRCLDRVAELRRSGVTIVFVTHEVGRVKTVCDRAIWMDDGQVKVDGVPRRVTDFYLEAVLARLSGGGADNVRAGFGDDSRWGTREAEVDRVELTRAGERATELVSGAEVTVEVDYRVHAPLDDPVLGLGIFRADGLLCWGSNTRVEGISVDPAGERCRLRVRLESLALVPGEYFLDAGIHSAGGHYYDYRHRGFPFEVVEDSRSDEGVLRPVSRWEVMTG